MAMASIITTAAELRNKMAHARRDHNDNRVVYIGSAHRGWAVGTFIS